MLPDPGTLACEMHSANGTEVVFVFVVFFFLCVCVCVCVRCVSELISLWFQAFRLNIGILLSRTVAVALVFIDFQRSCNLCFYVMLCRPSLFSLSHRDAKAPCLRDKKPQKHKAIAARSEIDESEPSSLALKLPDHRSPARPTAGSMMR